MPSASLSPATTSNDKTKAKCKLNSDRVRLRCMQKTIKKITDASDLPALLSESHQKPCRQPSPIPSGVAEKTDESRVCRW